MAHTYEAKCFTTELHLQLKCSQQLISLQEKKRAFDHTCVFAHTPSGGDKPRLLTMSLRGDVCTLTAAIHTNTPPQCSKPF